MNREYADRMARQLTGRPVTEQLHMAGQMLEQAELPNASVVHKQSMLGIAHALLTRITTDIAGRLAAMGIHAQPEITLPREETKKKPRREW